MTCWTLECLLETVRKDIVFYFFAFFIFWVVLYIRKSKREDQLYGVSVRFVVFWCVAFFVRRTLISHVVR